MTAPFIAPPMFQDPRRKNAGAGTLGPLDPGSQSSQPDQSAPPQTTFGPDQNLVGTQFGPTAQPTGLLNQAQQQIGQAQLGPLQGFGQDVTQARQTTSNLLGSLTQSPDRSTLAGQTYQQLLAQTVPEYQAAARGIMQQAAAGGRLGSGMTSEALTSDPFGSSGLGLQLGKYQANLAKQLATESAGQTLQDRLSQLGAAQGVAQGLGGLDLSQQGLGLQQGTTAANLALGRGQALSGLAGQQFGMGQTQREQMVGERGYQQGMDQQAIENRVRQQQVQDQLLNSAYGREANTAGMLGGYGFQGPSPTGLGLADYYSQQGGDTNAAIAELLNSMGQGTPSQGNVPKKWDPSSQQYVTPYTGG